MAVLTAPVRERGAGRAGPEPKLVGRPLPTSALRG